MRLVQQRRLASIGMLQASTVAASTSTKQTPSTTALPPAPTPSLVQPSLVEEPRETKTRHKAFGETNHSIGAGRDFDGAFVRRQPQIQEQGPAGMQQQILKARAYSNRILKQQRLLRQRPRINGPVLAPNPVEEVEEQAQQPVNRNRLQLAAPTSAVDNGPTIYESHISAEEVEPRQDDYHHRKGMTVEKRFKLVPNKVSYRPRLKIRRPGEQFTAAARGEANAKSSPITLPHLTPFQPKDQSPLPINSAKIHNYPNRRLQPEGPTPEGHLHHRQHIGTNREVLPLPPTDSFEQPQAPSSSSTNKKLRLPIASKWNSQEEEDLIQSSLPNPGVLINSGSSIQQPVPPVSSPPPPPSPPTTPPQEWGSVGEQPPQPSPVETAPPPQAPSPPSGDSGLAFGGDIGTPPPGFNEAFGLNGDETSLKGSTPTTTSAPPPTTPPPPPPTPPPTPQQPIVIPENSGLRPVAPPREFQGGFGSSGGGSGFGGGVEPPPPPPPPPRREPEPPSAPDAPAENVFTGESALMPNRIGPTGDGYGPPVFPVPGAVPPVVPAVNFGGAAAGIPPYQMGGGPSSAEEVKNEATTVKPSALLSILNKADEGFNQVINHFEQGTPLESTAIDVLEVALGSQKLDSQAKLLSHVDRTIGLDNIQRLQRWANTGGALDMLKEQFVKLAKNYKPPPDTKAITIPPQLEYLFQSGSG
uniref:Uncharacterized protein n=1 Tax=Ditylenchus dipsaci TaxID=166011 RepID=A0A915CQN3_9BILA